MRIIYNFHQLVFSFDEWNSLHVHLFRNTSEDECLPDQQQKYADDENLVNSPFNICSFHFNSITHTVSRKSMSINEEFEQLKIEQPKIVSEARSPAISSILSYAKKIPDNMQQMNSYLLKYECLIKCLADLKF